VRRNLFCVALLDFEVGPVGVLSDVSESAIADINQRAQASSARRP